MRIPHGVPLSGAPGTGKTLLARALAGEAGVAFFSMSASEFVEMIVGVGASLRPARHDPAARQDGRKQILRVHTRSVPLADDVDLDSLAAATVGMVGADLANLANEAAQDRRRTAYHEAGHALNGMLTPGADPVRKISIIPRTMSLGVTLAVPTTDRFSYDKQSLLARIKVATGGRAAEELVFGEETTGAEADIHQATELAAIWSAALG